MASSQNPSSKKSTFPRLDSLFNIPHKIIHFIARDVIYAAINELTQPTHKLTRWVENTMGWAIIGGIPVLLLWSSYVSIATWERLRGRRAEIIQYEASRSTTSSLRATRTVTLEDNAHRIYASKMPKTSVKSLPSINVPRKADDKFLSLFDGNERQTIGCGKSTLVIKALKDRQSVVKIGGFSTESMDTILGKIGETGSREAAEKVLTTCTLMGRKPIIICEYKMTGRKDEQKSIFKDLVDTAKLWQHDEGICQMVFVLSDATVSSTLSKDTNRWISFWVGDFESDEATEYLQQHKIPDVDIPQYLDHLGPRPNDLLGLVNAVDKEQFIQEKEQEARKIIGALKRDPGQSKEQMALIASVLKEKAVDEEIAWSILFPAAKNKNEQKENLLQFLKDDHLYQLKDGKILFHCRVKERVAQEMYRAGELKIGH